MVKRKTKAGDRIIDGPYKSLPSNWENKLHVKERLSKDQSELKLGMETEENIFERKILNMKRRMTA